MNTKKLNLNDGQLLALGILSGNDYAQNIAQKGIGRIFNFITKTTAKMTTSEIVSSFEEQNKCPGHFKHAMDVFESLQENGLDDDQMVIYKEKVMDCNTLYNQLNSQMTNLLTKNRRIERTEKRSLADLQHLAIFRGPKIRKKVRYAPLSLLNNPRYSKRVVTPAKADPVQFVSVNRFTLLNEKIKADTEDTVAEEVPEQADDIMILEADAGGKMEADEDDAGSNAGTGVKQKNQKKTKKKQKKKQKIGVHGSARKDAGDTEETPDRDSKRNLKTQARQHSKQTTEIKNLAQKHPTETWRIGVLKAKLRSNAGADLTPLQQDIFINIKNQTSAINRLMRLAQMAVQFTIETIVSSQDSKHLPLLQDLLGTTKGEGGISCWNTLLTFLNNQSDEKSTEKTVRTSSRLSEGKTEKTYQPMTLVEYFKNLKVLSP